MHARLKAPFIGSGSRNERTVRDTENKTACSKQVLPACMIELGISKDRPFVASLLVSHCESGNGIRTRSVRQGIRVLTYWEMRVRSELTEANGTLCIRWREVKFLDPFGTDCSEGFRVRTPSLIKNESAGIEDDQIPS